jgi:hypothetical protein
MAVSADELKGDLETEITRWINILEKDIDIILTKEFSGNNLVAYAPWSKRESIPSAYVQMRVLNHITSLYNKLGWEVSQSNEYLNFRAADEHSPC